MTLEYDQARILVADALEAGANAHERSDFAELDRLFDSVNIPETRGDAPEFDKIGVALNFFDGWVDASNHNWLYYEEFSEDDWPRYARIAATALRTNREIPTPAVIHRFGVEGTPRDRSIRSRLAKLLRLGT